MVVIRDNLRDVISFAKLGKELGVDYASIKPCSVSKKRQFDVPYDEYNNNLFRNLLKLAEKETNDEYDVVVKWEKLSNEGKASFDVCYGTMFIISISAEGYVTPCPHLMAYDRDGFIIGNINDTRLKDLIKSKKYKDIQMKVREVDIRGCETNCLYYHMNEFLWNLKHPPEHINFV